MHSHLHALKDMLHDGMWFNTAVWLILDIGSTFYIENIDNEPLYFIFLVVLFVVYLLLAPYEG